MKWGGGQERTLQLLDSSVGVEATGRLDGSRRKPVT